MLNVEAETIRVFLTAENVNVESPPLELIEELSKFCGITSSEHLMLLAHILTQKELKHIEDDLQRRGIQDDIPEADWFIIPGKLLSPLRMLITLY